METLPLRRCGLGRCHLHGNAAAADAGMRCPGTGCHRKEGRGCPGTPGRAHRGGCRGSGGAGSEHRPPLSRHRGKEASGNWERGGPMPKTPAQPCLPCPTLVLVPGRASLHRCGFFFGGVSPPLLSSPLPPRGSARPFWGGPFPKLQGMGVIRDTEPPAPSEEEGRNPRSRGGPVMALALTLPSRGTGRDFTLRIGPGKIFYRLFVACIKKTKPQRQHEEPAT